MKKYLAITAAFLLVFFYMADVSYAQGKGPRAGGMNGQGENFVDADGDGVCDNEPVGSGPKNQGQEKPNFVDEDGDGVCDNEPAGTGQGNRGSLRPNFVDEDGDGVCDNEPAGSGPGNRGTVRPNFVDADGDGVCDNFANKTVRRVTTSLKDNSSATLQSAGMRTGSVSKVRGGRGR